MGNEYLTFTIDNNVYAVKVNNVKEVVEYKNIMTVPCTADYIEGIINSRNQCISVVNLRAKFNLQKHNVDKDTRIIVFETNSDRNVFSFGAVVDNVQEVIELCKNSMDEVPELGESIARRFIKGFVKQNEKFIIILDIDKIFTKDESDLVKATGESEKI